MFEKLREGYDADGGLSELKYLTTGLPEEMAKSRPEPGWLFDFRSIERAMFDLETSKMMSQIQDAADAALNDPEHYPKLFAFFTRGCRTDDLIAWLGYLDKQTATPPDPDVYSRLRLMMRRQLDGFQSVTTNRWANYNQAGAVAVGFLILLFALWNNPDLSSTAKISYSLFGGALAPVAKDLISGLARLSSSK
jgi:hypothetical protein